MTSRRQIWSLWDVMRLDLHTLAGAIGNLRSLSEAMAQARSKEEKFSLKQSGHAPESASFVASIATSIDLPVTAASAAKVQKCLEAIGDAVLSATDYKIQSLIDAILDLVFAFRKECKDRVALVISADLAEFYLEKAPLFGEPVSLKFGKVSSDISEAGKCLALERPTACVFHLMRVAEFAVKRLGKKLNVSIDVEKEGWYQIIVHVNKGVDTLPAATAAQRRKKQALGAAAAHLNSVRIATRNDVMHPKASYTPEEARTLFDATKALMQQMAKIV